MRRLTIALPLLLFSCTTGISLDTVDYNHLFHDSNSKVWLVNKVVIKDANISPLNVLDKDIVVFHKSGYCDYIALKDLTKKKPRKGFFILNSEKRIMNIEFEDKKEWDLNMSYLTEDSILLEPTVKSDIQIAIQLKPFPEL